MAKTFKSTGKPNVSALKRQIDDLKSLTKDQLAEITKLKAQLELAEKGEIVSDLPCEGFGICTINDRYRLVTIKYNPITGVGKVSNLIEPEAGDTLLSLASRHGRKFLVENIEKNIKNFKVEVK